MRINSKIAKKVKDKEEYHKELRLKASQGALNSRIIFAYFKIFFSYF